eukprot:2768246-Rhodomonas_salina.4
MNYRTVRASSVLTDLEGQTRGERPQAARTQQPQCTSMHSSHAAGTGTSSSKSPDPSQPSNGSASACSIAGRPRIVLPSDPHASVSASTTAACVST